jgi:hypothetical protein
MTGTPRLNILSTEGLVVRTVPSARDRSRIATHANAVQRFLYTGDTEQLDEFEGESVVGVRFETDPQRLTRFALAGEFDFLDLYDR